MHPYMKKAQQEIEQAYKIAADENADDQAVIDAKAHLDDIQNKLQYAENLRNQAYSEYIKVLSSFVEDKFKLE